eukprot:321722-Prymnesium_polylepis.1
MEFLQSTVSPSPCLPFAPSWRPSRRRRYPPPRRRKTRKCYSLHKCSDSVLLHALSKPTSEVGTTAK